MAESKSTSQNSLDKITAADLLRGWTTGQIELFIDLIKDKKGQDKIIQVLRYTETKMPVLTMDGCIDAEAKLMWGVKTPDKRNTGTYAKHGPDAKDECDFTMGTKSSGSFGELIQYYSDHAFPKAVIAFSRRADIPENTPGSEHYPKVIYRKTIGSKAKPATPAEQAAYTATADWRFTMMVKMETVPDKSGAIVNRPFLWKLNKPALKKVNGKSVITKEDIVVTSANIHEKITSGSVFMIGFTFGPITRKSTTIADKKIQQYYPSFNISEMTLVEQAPPRTGRVVNRGDDEMKALYERLQKSQGIAAAMTATIPNENEDEDNHDDEHVDAIKLPAPMPGAPSTQINSASSVESIMAQLTKLSTTQNQ